MTPNSPQVLDAPKPKKFFKSRNVAPDAIPSQQYQIPIGIHIQHSPGYSSTQAVSGSAGGGNCSAAPKIRLKINKKLLKNTEESGSDAGTGATKVQKTKTDKVKAEKVKVEKVKVKKVSKAKEKAVEKPTNIEKPTRILSRTRKVVNYTEGRSRSPSPSSRYESPLPAEITALLEQDSKQIEKMTNDDEPPEGEQIENYNSVIKENISEVNPANEIKEDLQSSREEPEEVINGINETLASPSHIKVHEHPPIVLRISKVSKNIFFYRRNYF